MKVEPDTINQNNYWLQAGRNIDLAFLVLACHGMDLMFYDESYDRNVQQIQQNINTIQNGKNGRTSTEAQ